MTEITKDPHRIVDMKYLQSLLRYKTDKDREEDEQIWTIFIKAGLVPHGTSSEHKRTILDVLAEVRRMMGASETKDEDDDEKQNKKKRKLLDVVALGARRMTGASETKDEEDNDDEKQNKTKKPRTGI